jgi:hypothetical protein
MTLQDKKDLIKILNEFLNEELGNKITRWNMGALVGTLSVNMDKIIEKEKDDNVKQSQE